ncbi:melatonin receptor type 1A-like [Stylophora pistillata]|uniref:melatonin receptor type 1A-like n=1 Tax=Stylophora pistillata TaxID=50429 RepID=UPI000C057085|nr:melatonin receptor type 1A-like [Stylophora pistillata]
MPFWIMSLYKGKWNLSQKWCEVSASVLDTLGLASILTMSLIALNRYVKVVKRALYIKLFPSKRFAWLCSGVVWLVSVLIATPPLYGWGKMSYDPDYFHCTFNWKEGHYSYAMLIGGVFNTTTFAIFYCYWKIYQTVKESTDNVNANVAQNGVGAPRFHRTDVKVLKSCFAVVCSFLLTWCPTAISVFVISAGVYIPHEALKVSTYLLFSSSLVNPIIYGIMNPQFKEAFKKVLSCVCYGNDNRDQSHARVGAVMIHPRSNETG